MRIRVHELARQLGVSSQRVLAEARRGGEMVRSASSLLEPQVAEKLRAAFRPPMDKPADARSSFGQLDEPVHRVARYDDYWDNDPPTAANDELTVAQAAREFRIAPATVRQWVHRGYLTSSGSRGRARLYRRGDLESAKAHTQRNTRRPPAPFPVSGGLTRRPVSTVEAAHIAGVSPSTIRMWVHRGRLQPLPAPGRGHWFNPIQVLGVARRRRSR